MADPLAFDEDVVMGRIRAMIVSMVGDRLSTLPNSTIPAVINITSNTNGILPPLPYITINYEGSTDTLGFRFNKGTIDIDIEGTTTSYPYYDRYTTFGVTIRCSGDEAGSILREIRNKASLPEFKRELHEVYGVAIEPNMQILRTPDLLATEYREIRSMLMTCHIVDRFIDYDGFVFDTVSGTGTLIDEEGNTVTTNDYSITP